MTLKDYSGSADRFSDLDNLYIDVFGDKRMFFVEDFYISGDLPVVKLKNFDSINDAKFLTGKNVYLDQEFELAEDEFLINDLLGAKIFYGKKFFGILKDVESYPGNDVLVIENDSGQEIMVPNVKDFVEKLDKKNKRIFLNPGKDLNYDQV